MKTFNIYVLIGLNVLFQSILFGQNSQHMIDYTNTREGENVEYCLTHKKKQKLLSSIIELQKDSLNKLEFEKALQKVNNGTEKSIVYKIPVVFHVLHYNGSENISDNQLLDALSILNRDFRKLNADALAVVSDFQGIIADIEIEFVLASKAPDGSCFNGITRTENEKTFDGEDGHAQVDVIKEENDVYQGEWAGNKYLNIFICEDIGGAAGYTYNPNSTSMKNGIWIKSTYIGSIGTSSELHSRALTHEVGHWLNLDHPWGDSFNPGESNCTGNDYVEDTPITIGSTSCVLMLNSCNDATSSSSSWNYDVVDNVENYMDYSYCCKMFTEGQKTRMRAALISSVGGRNNLSTQSNLLFTGADVDLQTLCKAEFSGDRVVICSGESITLTDLSYPIADSWLWTTNGGTPTSSTVQNPVITYSTPGEYTIALTATGGGVTDSETKAQYITVLPAGTSLPFYEGFETYSTIDEINNWFVYDASNDNSFDIEDATAYSGSKCVRLDNYEETAETIDELLSSTIDLSSIDVSDNVTLSFRYAYRKKNSIDSESLKILATTDCGETWITRKTISGASLSSIVVSSDWQPTSVDDWTTVHITTISSSYFVSNFRFKFQFNASGGNNLFIDDINLYDGDPSDQLVLAIEEQAGTLNKVEIYPNPTENEIHLSFNLSSPEEVVIRVYDLLGKIEKKVLIKGNIGTNSIIMGTENLASGFYTVCIQTSNSSKTNSLIIK